MPTIMTVDDSATVRAIITATLEERGYDVIEAQSGAAALDLLQVRKADLLLLDIMMPGMDGPTMLAELRARDDDTRVILLTARTETKIVAECMKHKIIDYINKPVIPTDLCGRIETILGPAPKQKSIIKETVSKTWGKLLLVDPSEKSAFRLCELLPDRVTLETVENFPRAMASVTTTQFQAVVLDNKLENPNPVEAMEAMRELIPNATYVVSYLKNEEDPEAHAWEDGFDGFMRKPFKQEEVDALLGIIGYYDYELKGVVSVVGTTLQPRPKKDYAASDERYFSAIGEQLGEWIEKFGANCVDEITLNFTYLPHSELSDVLVETAVQTSLEMGFPVRVIADEIYWNTITFAHGHESFRFQAAEHKG